MKKCPVCASTSAVIQCDDRIFEGKFKALIRFHFSETSYNHHLGGSSIEELLFEENPITAYREDWNDDAYEEAIQHLISEPYPEYDEGIALYAGYYEGMQNPHLQAIKDCFDEKLRELKHDLSNTNYFLLSKRAKDIVEPLSARISTDFNQSTQLFRARIGFSDSAYPLMGWHEERHYRPFEGTTLGPPPPPLAGVGRMNRVGVSFLYVASNQETAIAEVRPHPGHYCSVGAFISQRALRIADLSNLEVTDFASSDKELSDFILLKSMDHAFSMPVVPEQKTDYLLTQLLADSFRHLKFDGICYRSSVGSGKNYVFFDPAAFAYQNESAAVIKVQHLVYSTSGTQKMGVDEDYLTRPDGTFL